jgi:hypothetical protein
VAGATEINFLWDREQVLMELNAAGATAARSEETAAGAVMCVVAPTPRAVGVAELVRAHPSRRLGK